MSAVNCTIMEDLSSSVFLRISLAINLVICTGGIPVFSWATWKLWSMNYSQLFHVNFKIILQLHLFGFLLHCTGRIALHATDLINYMTIQDPCEMIPNIYRWLATIRSMTYEQDSVLIGVFVALVQFVVAALPLGFLYSQTKFDGVTMYYCTTAVTSAPYSAQVGAGVSSFFQIAGLISFHHLLRVNQKLREMHGHSSLSNRYQLEQNISSILCLKTFATMSVVYIVFQNSCYITLMLFASKLEKYQYYAILELNGSWPTYGIISILILSNTVKKLRRRIDHELKGHLKVPDQKAYFERFDKQIA